MPDDIPSLADLRRTRSKRPAPTPSLFDSIPANKDFDANVVTAADIVAEQSRSLNAHHTKPAPPAPKLSEPSTLNTDSSPVLTVAELVRRVRALVERSHGHVTVEGEISNWRPAASGHCYFTLKDGDAQLSIVLFRRQAQLLRFKPKDGDAVRISGQLSVYESRGQLQLIAETMRPTGIGALLAAVQALKEKLRREGVFANQRPLPSFPRCIGIVTSLHGAALRDIVKVCRRRIGVPDARSLRDGVIRHSAVNLLIYPAAVQGPNSAREVAAGVRWFAARAHNWHLASGQLASVHQEPHANSHVGVVDVILIARGGGSWEDLHGFDDEALCRAIHASSIPVLTGIGHATDSVLADSAADLCAPTPSAAAELVTAAQHNIADRLARLHARLLRASRYELLRTRQRLSGLSAETILARSRNMLDRRAQHLDELTYRAETALNRALRSRSTRLVQLETRLRRHHPSLRMANDRHRFDKLLQRLRTAPTPTLQPARTRLDRATSRLEALSPLRVLDRGYALLYTPTGTLLRNPAEAPAGTLLTAQLAQGSLRAKVTTSE